MSSGEWFTVIKSVPRPAVALVLFHYAGGNSNVFRELASRVCDGVQVIAADLPGRGRRFGEDLIDDISLAAHHAAAALLKERSKLGTDNVVLLGHSLGARLAFHIAQNLERDGRLNLMRLIASGALPPHLPRNRKKLHNLPQGELIDELHKYGGTPVEVLQDLDLMELLIPMLRADLKMAEEYACYDATPLACEITVFGGIDDDTVDYLRLPEWSFQTRGKSSVETFSGGHFFLQEQPVPVAATLNDLLQMEYVNLP
ncbi:thioesterase II family protein [Dyella sp.]|uniref:thioesterase II family protein n=1 Tax=Dyella sp. TaxID=1869338 RepID=UPI002ED14782